MRAAYETVGRGAPLFALHGAYSTRAEMRGVLEPVLAGRAVRRVYIDLPGHGDSRPSDDVRTPDDALRAVAEVVDREAPEGPVLFVGHSYGGHFARALTVRYAERVAGLALICPVVPGEQDIAAPHVVRDDGVSAQLEPARRGEYEGYFVVRTADTLARFVADVVPSLRPVDERTLDTAIEAEPIDAAAGVDAPVLVVSARHDAFAGWRRQQALVEEYPRATGVVVADAGHALPHERPALLAALLHDWLDATGVAR